MRATLFLLFCWGLLIPRLAGQDNEYPCHIKVGDASFRFVVDDGNTWWVGGSSGILGMRHVDFSLTFPQAKEICRDGYTPIFTYQRKHKRSNWERANPGGNWRWGLRVALRPRVPQGDWAQLRRVDWFDIRPGGRSKFEVSDIGGTPCIKETYIDQKAVEGDSTSTEKSEWVNYHVPINEELMVLVQLEYHGVAYGSDEIKSGEALARATVGWLKNSFKVEVNPRIRKEFEAQLQRE